MILLPEQEEILDVVCGDRDFWVISAAQHIAHVKPAKEGAATNLNLVTASGRVYSFLLTEQKGAQPDLKVYVTADPSVAAGATEVLLRRRHVGAAGGGHERSGRSRRRTAASGRDHRQLQAPVSRGVAVRLPRGRSTSGRSSCASVWHDGQFTYIKADATELPALYEMKDGSPALGELPGGARHVRRAEGHRPRISGARQGALRVPTGTVSHGRADSGHGARHGSAHAPARGAAPWRPDLAHGRPGVRPSRHHRGDRPTDTAGRGRRPTPANQAAAPNPDRLRDYQDRLRVLDERSRQQAQADPIATGRSGVL